MRYAETDQMGVVYHANYLVWCEMGRTDFIRRLGLSYADMERNGIALAVSELSARFHAAAHYDELIKQLRQSLGLTVLMVTHDLDSLHAVCDRVAVLLDKRVVVGTMGEMLAYDHPWVREYFHGPRGRAALKQG